jgi:hypothetical protein
MRIISIHGDAVAEQVDAHQATLCF